MSSVFLDGMNKYAFLFILYFLLLLQPLNGSIIYFDSRNSDAITSVACLNSIKTPEHANFCHLNLLLVSLACKL